MRSIVLMAALSMSLATLALGSNVRAQTVDYQESQIKGCDQDWSSSDLSKHYACTGGGYLQLEKTATGYRAVRHSAERPAAAPKQLPRVAWEGIDLDGCPTSIDPAEAMRVKSVRCSDGTWIGFKPDHDDQGPVIRLVRSLTQDLSHPVASVPGFHKPAPPRALTNEEAYLCFPNDASSRKCAIVVPHGDDADVCSDWRVVPYGSVSAVDYQQNVGYRGGLEHEPTQEAFVEHTPDGTYAANYDARVARAPSFGQQIVGLGALLLVGAAVNSIDHGGYHHYHGYYGGHYRMRPPPWGGSCGGLPRGSC